MGTQPILLFEKNLLIFTGNYVPSAFNQERSSISCGLGKQTASPAQKSEIAALPTRPPCVAYSDFRA